MFLHIWSSAKKIGGSPYIFFRIGCPGNNGGSGDNGDVRECMTEFLEIFQDEGVGCSSVNLVLLRVHMFQIVQNDVSVPAHPLHVFPLCITTRFYRCVDTYPSTLNQKRGHKIGLTQGFSPAYGNSTSGPPIETTILLGRLNNFRHCHVSSHNPSGSGRAYLSALAAVVTFHFIDENTLPIFQLDSILRAAIKTPPTVFMLDASVFTVNHLRIRILRFRITAPRTPERTTLHENQCSDAGSVVNGKSLYIEYAPF
jgi:hypothetical protein